MSPHHSYRVYFTPRTGSTLLCAGLAATGVAGQPGEFFNTDSLIDTYETTDYATLRERIWARGTSSNGVFGMKDGFFAHRYRRQLAEVCRLRGMDADEVADHEAVWADLFPNVRHIYLTRRNKVRQAVSWWRAIQDEVWHLEAGEIHRNATEFYAERYDFAALSHLFREAVLRECGIEDYYTRHGITPLTVVYEDMIANFPGTLRRILRFIDLDPARATDMEMTYRRTADTDSEHWVQRFRRELQDSERLMW